MVFAGAHPAALARHLFCSGVNPRHAHVPSRLPPRVFLFSGMMSWEDDERWRRLALGFKGINVFSLCRFCHALALACIYRDRTLSLSVCQ